MEGIEARETEATGEIIAFVFVLFFKKIGYSHMYLGHIITKSVCENHIYENFSETLF